MCLLLGIRTELKGGRVEGEDGGGLICWGIVLHK